MRKTALRGVVSALIASTAQAGQVMPAEMTSAAQMQMKAGAIEGCGLRVVAVVQDPSVTMMAVDVSFNFYRSGFSLVKAGVRMARMNIPKEVQSPPIRPLVSFWVRAVGKPATTPNKAGIFKSESPKGYLLYGTAASNLKCNTHQRKVCTWIRRRSTASFNPRTG